MGSQRPPPRVSVPPASAPDTQQELRQKLTVVGLARLGLTLGLLFVSLTTAADNRNSRLFWGTALALLLSSLLYAWLLVSRSHPLRSLAAVQPGVDLFAVSVLVLATGGGGSPLGFLLALPPLYIALLLGPNESRRTAVAAVVLYGFVVLLGTTPWGIALAGPVASKLNTQDLALQMVGHISAILSVAGLSTALAERASRVGGALEASERTRAELSSLYEDVLRSIPVGLLTFEPSGRIEAANPVAAGLFGILPAELLGTPVRQWLPELPAELLSSKAGPRQGDLMLSVGPRKPRVAWHVARLVDNEGWLRGGLLVLEDRSQTEELREAVARAERWALLGQLAAGLAHEIRNPLGAISGCAELVRESASLTEEDRELLSTVVRESLRLNALVVDMLAFARPREPERALLSLVPVVTEVARLAAAQNPAVPVRIELEESLPSARGDAGQLRQILWNLLRNAQQVSPKGEAVLLSLRRTEGGLQVLVADRGPGVEAALKEKIFEAFYSGRSQGTGLGLAIVRQLVEAHGSRIVVRDREGGGSEFLFELAAEEPAPQGSEEGGSLGEESSAGGRIVAASSSTGSPSASR